MKVLLHSGQEGSSCCTAGFGREPSSLNRAESEQRCMTNSMTKFGHAIRLCRGDMAWRPTGTCGGFPSQEWRRRCRSGRSTPTVYISNQWLRQTDQKLNVRFSMIQWWFPLEHVRTGREKLALQGSKQRLWVTIFREEKLCGEFEVIKLLQRKTHHSFGGCIHHYHQTQTELDMEPKQNLIRWFKWAVNYFLPSYLDKHKLDAMQWSF